MVISSASVHPLSSTITVNVPASATVMDSPVSPVDHKVVKEASPVDRMISSPSHTVVSCPRLTTGAWMTSTIVSLSSVHPLISTTTLKGPAEVISIVGVVSPVLHKYVTPGVVASSVSVLSLQIVASASRFTTGSSWTSTNVVSDQKHVPSALSSITSNHSCPWLTSLTTSLSLPSALDHLKMAPAGLLPFTKVGPISVCTIA